MRQLWSHAAVEQLQHLIVRRATNARSVLRQEVMWHWIQIQKDIILAIEEMDKECAMKVDALQISKETRDQSLLGSDRRLR